MISLTGGNCGKYTLGGEGYRLKVIKGTKRGKVIGWSGREEEGWVYENLPDPKERFHFRDTHDIKSVGTWLSVVLIRMQKAGLQPELYGNCEKLIEDGIYQLTPEK